MILQALRMTWRDWRAGELRFMFVALVIAVGALCSVGFFVDRVGNGLQRDANQLLGADLVLDADHVLPTSFQQQLDHLDHLQHAHTTSFISMAMRADQSQSRLVAVRAVSPNYPLRGQLTLDSGKIDQRGPAPGTVWVDRSVLTSLQLAIGDPIQLGDATFTVTHLIVQQPDRGTSFINLAPVVLLAESDLPATNLIVPGARVSYHTLLAGDLDQVHSAQRQLQKSIDDGKLKGIGIESFESGRREIGSTMDRAKQFLSLVSLLSALLAALAIALSARRFMLRHVDACAMLRCLGMTQNRVVALFLVEFILMGCAASVVGALVGYVGHIGLLIWLGSLVTTALPAPTLLPALQGIAIGLLLLVGFALPPLLQLRNVPHNLMVRRDTGAPKAHTLLVYALGLVMFALLLVWQTGNLKLAAYTLAGFVAGFIVFSLCAWLFLRLLKRLRGTFAHASWRFAIDALHRRPAASIVQVVALSLGLMALLLLTVIRSDLLAAWRAATPVDAPNQFIINILPDQKQAVTDLFHKHQVAQPELYPMIRGRLIQVNQHDIGANDFEADNAKRMVEREFNLSSMQVMPSHNQIVAGQWFHNNKPEASVEEGIAKTLKLKMGDLLRFDVGGQLIDVPITSLRKVEWGSMRVNFFVIIDPASAAGLPQTWITAFHLNPDQDALVPDLSRSFTNLTIIDTGAVLRQVQSVLDQVVAAVQFLFLFTIVCGVLVLYAALLSSQQLRLQEASLLRALGASKRQLSSAQWLEYGLLGSLAGLLAACGAATVGWVLAHQVFDFAFQPSPLLWLFGIVAGAVCALTGGWFGLRKILQQPPLTSLREA